MRENEVNLLVASVEKLENETEKLQKIPPGYARIELSTRGKIGAPKELHIRNLATRDALDLSLTPERDLPFRLIEVLDDLIYEDVSVKDFHEKEVTELLVRLYLVFYKTVIEGVPFPINDEDYKYLEERYPSDEYQKKIQQLETGVWKPVTDIDLSSVETFDLPEDFEKTATIKKKDGSLTITAVLPKFGDILIIRRWLDDYFKEDEEYFNKAVKLMEIRNRMIQDYENGKNIDLDRLPQLDPKIETQWAAYQRRKSGIAVDAIRALHLKKIDGVDYSDKSLSEKIAIIQADPRIDASVSAALESYFDKMKFGVKPEVRMMNPFTNEFCERRFSFRLSHIFEAIQAAGSNEYDIIPGEGDIT